jgi:methylmalonyl-CoA mutase N-terminal domain/subunit
MTDEIEAAVLAEIAKIDELGGAVAAIESGYMQREIAAAALDQERREQSGEKPLVAVNLHRGEEDPPELVVHAPDSSVGERQRIQLVELRARRDELELDRQLDRLRHAADGQENLIGVLMDCARADATLGEMVDVLRGVFGEFVEPAL